MPAQSSPYQGSQGFHRPRPSISHAASTPAGFTTSGRSEDSTTTTTKTATAGLPVKNVQNVNTKPLPSRPANHLQQQHNAYSKSYESPRLNQTHFDDSLPKTQVGPLPDEDEEILRTSTRPPLTSKFSFDNLTAMGEGAIESGGAFKRMVTKAWLQNISQAARNSTISSSSDAHANTRTKPSGATSHVTEQASFHISQSPPNRQPTSFATRFRREKEQQTDVKRSSSPIKRSVQSSTTAKGKGETSAMIIGNPELVHPALNGLSLPNTALGNGARIIGSPTEAFGMSSMNHRVYIPPASPPPRRSEDSVRSIQSSTSTSISYGSGCTTSTALSNSSSTNGNTPSCTSSSFGSARAIKHDRDLPYLPLRLKSTMDDYKPSFETRLSPTDAVEQLVLTPQLPPESAKYIYKALYPTSSQNETDAASTPTIKVPESGWSATIAKDDIQFGQSANSRPTSPLSGFVKSRGLDNYPSPPPLSPPFACISPLQAARKDTSTAAESTVRPVEPSASQQPNATPDEKSIARRSNTDEDRKGPFHAVLLQPIPSFPTTLSDDEKLINVHVGGSKVYTTRLSVVMAQSDSKIAVFLQDRLNKAGNRSNHHIPASTQQTPIHDAPEEVRLTKIPNGIEARLSEKYQEPGTVILNLPASPVNALRSARASIYDDIPSDEGEDCIADNEIFGEYANVGSFRSKLEVPMPSFPNPRQNRLRFSRSRSESNSRTNNGSANSTARSSEYASTEGEDDFLVNFLDTTPDNESEDPFILQSVQPSPLRPCNDQQQQEEPIAEAEATTKKDSSGSRCSNTSSDRLPSLSSSPNSSACQADSPILSSRAAKHFLESMTAANGAFEELITKHEPYVLHPINLYLDRSPESYDAIFHFLRTGALPRKLCLDDAILALSESTALEGQVSILSVLDGVPAETKKKLLPLVLYPILSELKDLKDEAEYLGFSALIDLCEMETSKLKRMIRWSRNIATHPGLHARSESEGALATHQASRSPPRLLGKQASRPRPRLVGHRQFNSESKVMPRPARSLNDQDNWI